MLAAYWDTLTFLSGEKGGFTAPSLLESFLELRKQLKHLASQDWSHESNPHLVARISSVQITASSCIDLVLGYRHLLVEVISLSWVCGGMDGTQSGTWQQRSLLHNFMGDVEDPIIKTFISRLTKTSWERFLAIFLHLKLQITASLQGSFSVLHFSSTVILRDFH